MSGSQFSEVSVSLQDWYDDLVDLIHCLVETSLMRQQLLMVTILPITKRK